MGAVLRHQSSPLIGTQLKAVQGCVLAARETGCNQQKVAGKRLLRSGNGKQLSVRRTAQPDGFQRFDPVLSVDLYLLHCRLINPRIAALLKDRFALSVIGPQGTGPFRPGIA